MIPDFVVADLSTGRHVAAALAELGLEPDLLSGHSLGEWSAMIDAGHVDAEQFIRFVAAQGPDEAETPDTVHPAVADLHDPGHRRRRHRLGANPTPRRH